MLDKVKKYIEEVDKFSSNSIEEIENFRIQYLGKNGIINDLFYSFKEIPPNEKKIFGIELNKLKKNIQSKINDQKLNIKNTKDDNKEIDLSLPATKFKSGTRHPISIVKNEIIEIFKNIGFILSNGPEIEDDWHNFTALNLPKDHPARDMQDTFFIQKNPDYLLRTHTSSVQVRYMEKNKETIKILSPGRVFRNESISARSHCIFHQIEGLCINNNTTFSDLKSCIYYFVKSFFGEYTKIRFRPSYFPFTEPSAEVDISCHICNGKGCNVCKYSGWVEILGCGMIDPNVLKNCEIDPIKKSGFAFGMGIERITMLKYQISDLRLFFENDIRFLNQFNLSI